MMKQLSKILMILVLVVSLTACLKTANLIGLTKPKIQVNEFQYTKGNEPATIIISPKVVLIYGQRFILEGTDPKDTVMTNGVSAVCLPQAESDSYKAWAESMRNFINNNLTK